MLIVPVNPNYSKQRDTNWVCVCPICQNERIISYAQKWNIQVGKASHKCKQCRLRLGETKINTEGLKLGRKFQRRKNKYKSNDAIFYVNLFNTEENKLKARQKQRAAKLGKTGELCNRWSGGNTPERLEKRKKQRSLYKKNKLKNDKVFYCMKLVRNRIWSFMKNKNLDSYSGKLGCDLKTFRAHIENKFTDSMNWENYGEWHIDHIFPLSVAISISYDKFIESCHYTNLQPLWALDNIKKGAKLANL